MAWKVSAWILFKGPVVIDHSEKKVSDVNKIIGKQTENLYATLTCRFQCQFKDFCLTAVGKLNELGHFSQLLKCLAPLYPQKKYVPAKHMLEYMHGHMLWHVPDSHVIAWACDWA